MISKDLNVVSNSFKSGRISLQGVNSGHIRVTEVFPEDSFLRFVGLVALLEFIDEDGFVHETFVRICELCFCCQHSKVFIDIHSLLKLKGHIWVITDFIREVSLEKGVI